MVAASRNKSTISRASTRVNLLVEHDGRRPARPEESSSPHQQQTGTRQHVGTALQSRLFRLIEQADNFRRARQVCLDSSSLATRIDNGRDGFARASIILKIADHYGGPV
jgi:hypothetical protein